MSMKTEIYRSALRDFDSMKTASDSARKALKSRIYASNPRLEEIDREMNAAGVSAAVKTLKAGNEEEKKHIKDELDSRLKKLTEEKEDIYKQLGITEDFFDSVYRCKKCKDTGMVDGKECSCFRQYLIQKAYGRSLLNEVSENERFETFNPEYYSKTEKDKHGITPYENMRIIYGTCLRFAKRFSKEYKNLLIMGKTGLGKTFLCNSIARKVLDEGFTVIYISAGRLFKTLQDEQFNRNEEEETETFYDDILTVDLLIIDDLGTEFSTTLVNAQFFNIINERMSNKRPLVISTNLTPDRIKEQYSDRVLSRMTDEFEFLTLTGDDIRIKKRFMM